MVLAEQENSVFREVVSGSEITYHRNRGQTDKLGGEASLTEAAKLEGNLHTATSKEDYLLQQKFEIPMRIMFLPEELRPLTRGLAEETVIGRRPVTQPLVWEDAEEPPCAWRRATRTATCARRRGRRTAPAMYSGTARRPPWRISAVLSESWGHARMWKWVALAGRGGHDGEPLR